MTIIIKGKVRLRRHEGEKKQKQRESQLSEEQVRLPLKAEKQFFS
jgi:hypothetical protein